MKNIMMAILLASGVLGAMGAEPVARITEGTVVIAAGVTNGVKEAWLNTGWDGSVITAAGGSSLTGAGIVRSLIYTAPAGVTNGVVAFYAYDAGVKRALYSGNLIVGASSVRYDLSDNVYSGRIRVEVFQASYTNAACTWTWAAIVE